MVKISEELEAIDNLLMEFHDRIRSGRCLINRTQSAFLFDYLHRLASKAANHQSLVCVSALNPEWAWSDVLEVPSYIFVDVIFWIFHFVSYNSSFL